MSKQKFERLDKVLSASGYGTRKEVKKIVKQGLVTVNGKMVKDNSTKIDPFIDDIQVMGQKVVYKENIYVMINKPQGIISSTHDDYNITVIDLLEGHFSHRDLFPVGRLDKDTEGLMLLTDDGKLAHRLLSPKNQVPKIYYMEVDGILTENDIKSFAKGIELEDFTTLPADLKILEVKDNTSYATVEISEGKFHQVKRMVKSVGKEVCYLKRISMGPLTLDENLEPGMWRELSDEEITLLKDVD